jgi:hypothetical protein
MAEALGGTPPPLVSVEKDIIPLTAPSHHSFGPTTTTPTSAQALASSPTPSPAPAIVSPTPHRRPLLSDRAPPWSGVYGEPPPLPLPKTSSSTPQLALDVGDMPKRQS